MSNDTRRWLDERFRDRPDAGAGEGDISVAWHRWRTLKLAETAEWAAAESPWYRRLLRDVDVPALAAELRTIARDNDPRRAADLLDALPFTTQADLAADSNAFLAVGQGEVEGLVSVPTSGTSGPVKRIGSTEGDQGETVAFFKYGMRFLVAPGRDRVALAMSPARPGNVGDLLGRALARWGIPFLAHGFVPAEAGEAGRWLDELRAWGPTCLVGVPPQMLALSRHEKSGLRLKTMLLSGDAADGPLVAELERNFPGCRVFRHYGLTETGLGGAVECGQRAQPHLRDDLWAEIIDQRGRPVEEGREGEIVLTPLTRRGLPLLRYRTGDEGALLPGPCPCGSVMPRLKVLGRLDDRIITPSGRALRVADLEAPLLGLPFVRDFAPRLHSGSPGGLCLLLTLTGDAPNGAPRLAAEALRRRLGPALAGLPLAVLAAEPGPAPPASGGKRRLSKTDAPLPTAFDGHCRTDVS
ncbi:MAG: AMP-binding protein [Candidatus Adiutrix sp.]|jgi:phenylacetate-coenzyme A ligase PaaK-like adenylate-forming protein|nr:AMP-binding protein [Candidatus Adiutrix sp.]